MMFMTPTSSAAYGVFWLSFSATPSFANYYKSVLALEPHLRDRYWTDACQGFYLSSVDYGIPRLSYFSADGDKAAAAIEDICSRTGLVQVKPIQPLSSVKYANSYGGSELAFRQYLCDYTQIGLDLLKADRITAQRLCATYRWHVQPSGGQARPHFEHSLLRSSETYRAFSHQHRETFWTSFDFRDKGFIPWDHMFINQVICYDAKGYIVRKPFSFAQITSYSASRGHDFDVPEGWTPE